jgi:hypothetical protein
LFVFSRHNARQIPFENEIKLKSLWKAANNMSWLRLLPLH